MSDTKSLINSSFNAEASLVKFDNTKFNISLSLFKKQIVQNLVLSEEDKEKLILDLFQKSKDLLEQKFAQISEDMGTKKIIGDALNCLASCDKNIYQQKRDMLDELLTKKLDRYFYHS